MFESVEAALVEYCSPTLAGIKPANMFSTNYDSLYELRVAIDKANSLLSANGIAISILNIKEARVLLYVYRYSSIERILERYEIQEFLSSCGYSIYSPETALEYLRIRISKLDCFPHEIGIFLGYPLEDVKGFIRERGCNYKCSGCWKVYSSETEALRYFEKLEKCKEEYKRLYRQGISIQELTVKAV